MQTGLDCLAASRRAPAEAAQDVGKVLALIHGRHVLAVIIPERRACRMSRRALDSILLRAPKEVSGRSSFQVRRLDHSAQANPQYAASHRDAYAVSGLATLLLRFRPGIGIRKKQYNK